MTVSSWGDVAPGTPAHFHCLGSIEHASDPKHWTDASTTSPSLVAWSPAEVISWMRDQLEHHSAEVNASDAWDGERLAAALDSYTPTPAPLSEWTALPDLWERVANCTSHGRWAMETWKLSSGRRLVLQVLGVADRGQPGGEDRGRPYEVCRQHDRPAEAPYCAPADLAAV